MNYQGSRLRDKIFLFYIRNTFHHPFKIRIINWLNDVFFNNLIRIKRSNGGGQYDLSTREYIGHEIIFSGSYEPLTLNICENLLKQGGVFIDIGANVGLFSIQLSKLTNVIVYSVEPSFLNFQKLLSNISLNKVSNIHPINIGLSDRDSFGYLINNSPANSGTFRVVDTVNDNSSYLIRLCTLSELVKYFGLSEIDLIKIDVEGFEMNVFKGYFNHNLPSPKNIIMEFSGLLEQTGYTVKECYDYFTDLGYEHFTIAGDKYNLGDILPESNLWLRRKY
ncbi:MAG TPA: FkbM family methyltransferase [Mucilaginibacter sp.]|jgi:FkbM family methyltransferase|nr:FkbM family methyltransferase [Mucilaginibacter sp.]